MTAEEWGKGCGAMVLLVMVFIILVVLTGIILGVGIAATFSTLEALGWYHP